MGGYDNGRFFPLRRSMMSMATLTSFSNPRSYSEINNWNVFIHVKKYEKQVPSQR